jgi:hypothetical protein
MHGRVEKCIQGFDGETKLVYTTWYTWMWMERLLKWHQEVGWDSVD